MASRMTFAVLALGFAALAFPGCRSHDTVTVTGTNGAEMTFRKPHSETMRRNETGEITLRIERKGFVEPVAIDVEGLPNGVRVLNAPLQFEQDQERMILHLQAANDADLVTDRVITVRVHGPGTAIAAQSFELTIKPSR